ncbi:MAG: YdeI/OmpD-associated family protein [Acidobacteriaceae bacterium]
MATISEGRIAAVDEYIGRTGAFAQPVLLYLREAVHEGAPGVVEAIKWSMPFFVYKGVILANMAAFKAHCSFGLWGASAVKALQTDGIAQGGNMGSLGKITSTKDLPSRKKLVGYVKLAARSIDDGETIKAWTRPKVAKPALDVPPELETALKKNKGAAKKFETITPGGKREYCQWIAEAKREETREKRAALAAEWIAEGKSRNWKYE